MGLPEVVIAHEWGPPPAPAPIAGWWDEPDRLEIALPGLGAIRVDPDRVVVTAPSEDVVGQLLARLGAWARAHWWTMQGFGVCRATVVGRDGRAIALIGVERVGVSLLALALTEHGWSVISDGVAAFDARGVAMSIPGPVSVDAKEAAQPTYKFEQVVLPAGRERVGLVAPAHPSAPLAGYVSVRAQRSMPALVVRGPLDAPPQAPSPTTAIASTRSPAGPLPARGWWQVDRPIPQHVEAMSRSTPSVIAGLLAPLLAPGADSSARHP